LTLKCGIMGCRKLNIRGRSMKRTILTAILAVLIVTPLTIQTVEARRGGSCDGIHRCRCGSTQAAHFGFPRNYNGHNLWLASEWPRAFPRTSAHPGAVGYQPGHVFRLVSEVHNGRATVSDDKGTYERRVSGAVFVDPNGSVATRVSHSYSARSHRHSHRLARVPKPVTYARWNAL
jgi:hypothetical protein